MIIDQFRERIRLGVVTGAYDHKKVIEYIRARGWHTTADVPVDQQQQLIDYFDKLARDRAEKP